MKLFVAGSILFVSSLGGVYWFGAKYLDTQIKSMEIADAINNHQVGIGKNIYAENCTSCHGVNLEGQPNWRVQLPEGGLPAPPHDETGHTWHHSDALNFKYTKLGGQKIAPEGFKSNMPGFGESLSDGQNWAVLAYIKSRWPEQIRRRHTQQNK